MHDRRLRRVGWAAAVAELLYGLLQFQGERASKVRRRYRTEGRGGRAGVWQPWRWTSGCDGLQREAAHDADASLWDGGGLELRELGHLDAFGSHAKSYAYWVCFDRYQTCPYKILAWFIPLLARSEVLPIKSMILSVLRPHACWFCQHTGIPVDRTIRRGLVLWSL